LWHEEHEDDEGWLAAHDTPGFRWHEAQATAALCPLGALWHEAQLDPAVCRNTAFLKAMEGEWHVAHAPA
jgi:hypothetical protein